MNRVFIALAVVMAITSPVAAQAPGAELPLSAFLEKRVPDELAAEGHLLSRDNLTLKVESAGAIFIVSLVDLNTGRVAASTKIDQLPPDREAAVASVTHVAADLITQISGREPPPPAPPPVVIDDRPERAARQRAELELKKQMIRFDDTYDAYIPNTAAGATQHWTAYRGGMDQELSPKEFYKLVGHPELAKSHDLRHGFGIGGMMVGIGLSVGALVYLGSKTGDDCSTSDPNFEGCIATHDNAVNDAAIVWAFMTAIGVGVFVGGLHYVRHSQPITENEARTMAEQYNNGIRQNLGLPVVERHWFHDVHVAPYVTHGEGGLALGARF